MIRYGERSHMRVTSSRSIVRARARTTRTVTKRIPRHPGLFILRNDSRTFCVVCCRARRPRVRSDAMMLSLAILLGCAVGGLVIAWYTAIARLYRSERLAAIGAGTRVAIAAFVGFVFVAPAILAGCLLLATKAIPTITYQSVESEMNARRQA